MLKLNEIKNQRILISPLNWGMGHVSRCIGLIHQLIEQKNEIFIACDESQKNIFLEYFKDLEFIDHEGYPFDFSGKGRFSWDLLKRAKQLNKRRKREMLEVEEYVKKYSIDVVLSDHRYGFRSKKTPSVFITHQINLPVLWFEIAIQRIHIQLVRKFDAVWILDFKDSRLAGELSRNKYALTADFIGPYSRFQLYPFENDKTGVPVLVVSGPSEYHQDLINCSPIEKRLQLIGGNTIDLKLNMKSSPLTWRDQDKLMLKAPYVISRSGYSTIMDLHFLQVEATLFATPGQREQSYLLERFNK